MAQADNPYLVSYSVGNSSVVLWQLSQLLTTEDQPGNPLCVYGDIV